MKTYLIVIIIGVLTVSCSKDDESQIKIDPDNEISFEVELINSNEDFISKAKNLTIRHKSSGWFSHLEDDEIISLNRSTHFDLELENGKILEFSLGFRKKETNKDLLILEDENLNSWKRNWDYKTFEDETTDLYQKLETFEIVINARQLGFHSADANFSFVSSEKALVNGEEKSYVTIKFEGDALGYYDPDGQFGVYKITNGTFKGVIE